MKYLYYAHAISVKYSFSLECLRMCDDAKKKRLGIR